MNGLAIQGIVFTAQDFIRLNFPNKLSPASSLTGYN